MMQEGLLATLRNEPYRQGLQEYHVSVLREAHGRLERNGDSKRPGTVPDMWNG